MSMASLVVLGDPHETTSLSGRTNTIARFFFRVHWWVRHLPKVYPVYCTFQDGCGVRAHEGHINSGGFLAWLTAGSTWGICRLVGWAVCCVVLGRSEVSLSQRAFWRGLAVTLKENGLLQKGPVAVCSPKCQRWKKKALRFQNFMKDSGSCNRLANYPLAPQRNQNLYGLLFADITDWKLTHIHSEGNVFWINSDKLQSAKEGISCFRVCFMPRRRLGQLEKKFEVGSMPAIKHVLQNAFCNMWSGLAFKVERKSFWLEWVRSCYICLDKFKV